MENYIKVEKTGLNKEIFYKLLTGENDKIFLAKLINVSSKDLKINPEDIDLINDFGNDVVAACTKNVVVIVYFKYLDSLKEDLSPDEYKGYVSNIFYISARMFLDTFRYKDDVKVISIVISEQDIVENHKFWSSYRFFSGDIECKKSTDIFIQLPYLMECDDLTLRDFYQMLYSHTPDLYKGSDEVMDMVIEEIKKLN